MLNNPITMQEQMLLDYFNIKPSFVSGQNNLVTNYHKRLLLNKVFSVYNFKLPDKKMLAWFRYWLFCWGSISYIDTKSYLGWVLYPYSVESLDTFYRPSDIEVVLNDERYAPIDGKIGENAEIIYLVDDRFGIMDIVDKYAELLAQCDKDINVNLMNANVALGAYASDSKEAYALREAYSRATTGEPFIVMNQDLLFDSSMKPFFKDVKNSYIVNDLLTSRRSIINQFLTEIGIRNSNYDKRERLTASEIAENNDETRALVLVWFDNLKECFARCASLSGEEFSVSLNYEYINREESVNV